MNQVRRKIAPPTLLRFGGLDAPIAFLRPFNPHASMAPINITPLQGIGFPRSQPCLQHEMKQETPLHPHASHLIRQTTGRRQKPLGLTHRQWLHFGFALRWGDTLRPPFAFTPGQLIKRIHVNHPILDGFGEHRRKGNFHILNRILGILAG
ncbi:MAG: hypothetical protein VST67_10750 [Nitrospirota bacterium]|nr:hypothetical protein [Nitrospirota bacterium]